MFLCFVVREKDGAEKHHTTGEGWAGGEIINQTENNQKGIRGGLEAKKLTFFITYEN